jgi:hypothetical protein
VTRLPPLTEISPRDSMEQKGKDSKERLRQNRIDERYTMHHGRGVLSFLHNHLVHSSSSIVLLSLGQSRASIVVWWCRHFLSWGGQLTSIRTLEGKVTWYSTVVTNLACLHWCCTMSSWVLCTF